MTHHQYLVLMLGLVVVPFVAAPAVAQTLQERIDAAQVDDVIVVDPGVYSKPITVDKRITIRAATPGTVTLAGATAGQATLENLVFDGSVADTTPLVTAGDDLQVRNCRFQDGLRGISVAGAGIVRIQDCTFEGLFQGILLQPQAGEVLVSGSSIANCTFGLGADADPEDDAGPREPALRCEDGLPVLDLTDVTITGGERQLRVDGGRRVQLLDCALTGGTTALQIERCCLVMTACEITGPGFATGVGARTGSVSGAIERSGIGTWQTGLIVDDAGSPRFSDIRIGFPELEVTINDFVNGTWNLRVEQPEALPVGLNFWGTTECAAARAKLFGQDIDELANEAHDTRLVCSPVVVESATWGALKTRFREER